MPIADYRDSIQTVYSLPQPSINDDMFIYCKLLSKVLGKRSQFCIGTHLV